MRQIFGIVISFLWIQYLSPCNAFAASPILIVAELEGGTFLNSHIEYPGHNKNRFSILDVCSSDGFQNTQEGTPNFKFTKSAYWFRFSIMNKAQYSLLLLKPGYSLPDNAADMLSEPPTEKMSPKLGGARFSFTLLTAQARGEKS
jgi:hypothetical protein